MRVVFALQSPTLLNILATSTEWQLEVCDLGDHPGMETTLLTAPYYKGGVVEHVFVCSPEHWRRAQEEFPGAKLWWVIHNCMTDLIPEVIKPKRAIALSNRVRDAQRKVYPDLPIYVIVPSYEPRPVWQWTPESWTMISRPNTRHPEHLEKVQQVRDLARVPHMLYGEGEPGGFLDNVGRLAQQSACAAYLSALPTWSGFGLAEHECLAAGVPVVGSWWGDMQQELNGYHAFSDDEEEQAAALSQLCSGVGPVYGRILSQMGLDFIRDFRRSERMNLGIAEVLECEK